jgi:transposase
LRRYELTDEQWDAIKHIFDPAPERGRPRREPRQMLNAALWVLRSGAPWRDLPERYGPWQTAYHRFNQWSRDGTWDRILEALHVRLDREGHIDWDLWCIDGTSIRASRAAAGAGKRGAAKNPRTTLWAAQEADSAQNCTWLLTAEEYPLPLKSPPESDTNRRSSSS